MWLSSGFGEWDGQVCGSPVDWAIINEIYRGINSFYKLVIKCAYRGINSFYKLVIKCAYEGINEIYVGRWAMPRAKQ